MKFLSLITISAYAGKIRFRDLHQMAENSVETMPNGIEKFNPQMYWGYGRHCVLLDDLSLSETPEPAKDWLERACKNFNYCQSCVYKQQEDVCSHNVQNEWNWNEGEFALDILEPLTSCRREFGECDKKFLLCFRL